MEGEALPPRWQPHAAAFDEIRDLNLRAMRQKERASGGSRQSMSGGGRLSQRGGAPTMALVLDGVVQEEVGLCVAIEPRLPGRGEESPARSAVERSTSAGAQQLDGGSRCH